MTCFSSFNALIDGHHTFWAFMAMSCLPHDPRAREVRLWTSPTMLERVEDVVAARGITCDIIPAGDLEQMTTGSLWQRGQAQWTMAKRLSKDSAVFLPFFRSCGCRGGYGSLPGAERITRKWNYILPAQHA